MVQSAAYRLSLYFLLTVAASVRDAAPVAKPTKTAPAPLRLERLDVKTQAGVKSVTGKQQLQAQQDFAVRLTNEKPLYLYVLLEHADAPRAVFYPGPDSKLVPVAGPIRLPQKIDDWFFADKVEPGDRLCLIGSERPIGQPSCKDSAIPPEKGRGEDSPPSPAQRRAGSPPPPPPPPDDTDPSRGGRKQWVILLPLTAS